MAGRKFDVPNRAMPVAVRRMANQRPDCFLPEQWREWLSAEWRHSADNDAHRRAMLRGTFPNPCQDCTAKYQRQMQAQNKCAPTDFDLTPLGESAVQDHQKAKPATAATDAGL